MEETVSRTTAPMTWMQDTGAMVGEKDPTPF
jgi:hypothetical protein